MKRKQLNMDQLAVMTIGLMRNLFPSPSKTDLLVEENSTAIGNGFYLYFSKEYFDKLTEKMEEQYMLGNYANGNAEQDWVGLMKSVRSAESIADIDKNNLIPHFLAK